MIYRVISWKEVIVCYVSFLFPGCQVPVPSLHGAAALQGGCSYRHHHRQRRAVCRYKNNSNHNTSYNSKHTRIVIMFPFFFLHDLLQGTTVMPTMCCSACTRSCRPRRLKSPLRWPQIWWSSTPTYWWRSVHTLDVLAKVIYCCHGTFTWYSFSMLTLFNCVVFLTF